MPDLTDREALIKLSTQMESLFNLARETKADVKEINDKVDRLEDNFRSSYVTKEEFEPIKKAVYGFIGIIITSVVLAVVAFFMNGGGGLISNVP